MNNSPKPVYFETPEGFRKWLLQNHTKEKELLVGFYKVKSNKPSMTWSESVDQAICFGWIDGVRRSIDHESYSIVLLRENLRVYGALSTLKKLKSFPGKA